MTQESKYYTPKIKEISVGFECEKSFCGSFSLCKITECDLLYLTRDKWEDDGIKEDISIYRVKYLDEDDIVSLGFGKQTTPNVFNDDEFIDGFTLTIDESNEIFLYKDNLDVKIAKQTVYNQTTGNWTDELLFQGKIKNKSELKRLLEQLGITES